MDLGNENKYYMRCTGLPAALLDKTTAKDHFSTFGRILSIHLRSKTKGCTVEYADEESLQCALVSAGKYNGKSFSVTRGPKPSKKASKKDLWTPSIEVQQELKAMSGVGIYKLGSKPKEKKATKSIWSGSQKKAAVKVSEHSTSSISSIPAEQKELLNVIKQSAQTVEEKFRILEARDKLIRLRTQKHADLDSKHTVGTCPDMCPEKERLMRETQHQVALYEQEPLTKTLNPFLAVKQYSRSSADQETPLPHELRPVNVLQMTMGYLMHKIIPLCDNPEVNLAEWYHFMWDRTRGIRKDITQQELCSQGSVELVEQCARFHIHCSARLVAEDSSVFDHKINTENLTKCLQTLKYMYHDLQCKNESCPNEAEFRGYVILLNLNDMNFMWEVQQLRGEIQKSKEVQFALKIHSALDKNNYVKFFKLVKSTTYLNACILLRYFIQVRVKAIKTILKSFSPRGLTQFPLQELQDILAFEGSASTRDFIEYYGLYMNNAGTHIRLDRSNFNIPELPYTLDRAINIVESKRATSIGEIICGGELPLKIFETHEPHSSFDELGFININEYFSDIDLVLLQTVDDEKPEDKTVFSLKKADSRSNSPFDTVDSSDTKTIFGNKKSIFGKSERSQDSIFGQKTQQENIFGKKETAIAEIQSTSDATQTGSNPENVFESIFKPTTIFGQNPKSIFGKPVQQKSIFGSTSSSIFQQPPQNKTSIFPKPGIFASTSKPEIFPTKPFETKPKVGGFSFNLSPPKKVPPTQQNKIEENHIFKLQKHEEEAIRQKVLEEKLQVELRQKEEQRKRLEEIEMQKRLEEEREKQRVIQQKILNEQLIQKRIQEEKIREEEIQRRRLENERKRLLELERKIEVEKRKMEEHRKMQEIRRSVNALVKDLLNRVEEKNRNDRLNEIKQKIINRKMKYFILKWRNNIVIQKRKRKAMDDWPVWVNCISHEEEAKELMQNNQLDVLMDMKRYKFGRATKIDVHKEEKLEPILLDEILRKLLKGNWVKNHLFWKIDVCFPTLNESENNLKKIEQYISDLLNLNSPIITRNFFGKTITSYFKQHEKFNRSEVTDGFIFINDGFTKEFYTNIKETVKNDNRDILLPIAVILSNSNYDETKLDELIQDDLISDYVVFFNEFNPRNLSNLFRNSLEFLIDNVPKQPSLELDLFRSFLMKYLVGETWERITSFAEYNRPFGMCLTNPKTVFNLYREIVKQLQTILFNENTIKHKDFPKILLDHLDEKSPNSLPCDYKYFPSFWKNDSYRRKLHRVFSTLDLPEHVNIKWPPKDVIELETIIYDLCEQFQCPEKTGFAILSAIIRKLEQLGNFSDIKYMMLTDVMRMLTVEKLKTVDFILREPFVSESIFDELFVVYDSRELENFKTEYWFYTDPAIQEEMDCKEIVIEESDEETICEEEFDLDKTLSDLMKYDEERDENLLKNKAQMKEVRDMLSDLEEGISIQKKISNKLQQTLSLALNGSC